MTTVDESILTQVERDTYGPLADVLIPNAEGMPAATEVGVHIEWIDLALAARPDLVNAFREAVRLGTEAATPEAAVETMHKGAAELFDAFSVLTAGAYLMNPQVKELIGYPGQEERPVTGDDMPEYIDMLEHVALREGVHRPTVTS